jgi:hypothetical protein
MRIAPGYGLVVGLVLVFAGGGQAAAPPPVDVRPLLDWLLIEHRKHGLPLPPEGAKLMRGSRRGSKMFSLAFRIEDSERKKPPRFMCGIYPIRGEDWTSWKAIAPTAAAQGSPEGMHQNLIFALQCHSLGWNALAKEVLLRCREYNAPTLRTVHVDAWIYWTWQIPVAGSDRALILRHLKGLMAAEKELASESNRWLGWSLQLALVPSRSARGTTEAMIDDLLDDSDSFGGLLDQKQTRPGKVSAHERLARLGFKVVPALIDHLNDQRLTRSIMHGFNNFPTWNMRVEHVVSVLLEEIAGQEIGRDWHLRQLGYPITKDAARKWWREASKLGEEAYALRNVLPKEGDEPKEGLLRVLVIRYPKHLPGLYRKVLDEHPKIHSGPLAEAVVRSSLPLKEKLAVLHEGARRSNPAQVYAALYQLRDIDHRGFVQIILRILYSAPRDVQGSYWTASFVHLVNLAVSVDDDQIWKAIERAARRASIGLRMELLSQAADGDATSPRQRERALALLASFLDDSASRDLQVDPKKYEGPCAGCDYRVLSVRDFAAMGMASLLGIDVPLKPNRSANEWAALRTRVKEAWKREQARLKDKPPPK